MSDDSSSSEEPNISSCNNKVRQLNMNSPQEPNSVVINNSNDITIGDKFHYYGPVTIVQNHISHNPVHQFDLPKSDDQPTLHSLIISRKEWSAREPQRPLFPLELPAVNVIIAHTAGQNIVSNQVRENHKVVRNIQEYHTQVKKWDDIGYNFLIGGAGCIYVGRGWNYIGAHSKIFNQKAICIAFMGNFCEFEPSPQSLVAAQRLIAAGVEAGKLVQHYRLYGHRQVNDTISPGDRLYEIIQTWDHWTQRAILP